MEFVFEQACDEVGAGPSYLDNLLEPGRRRFAAGLSQIPLRYPAGRRQVQGGRRPASSLLAS